MQQNAPSLNAFLLAVGSIQRRRALPQRLSETPRRIHLPTHFVVAPPGSIVTLLKLQQAYIHLRVVEVRLQLHCPLAMSEGVFQFALVEECVAQAIAGLGVVRLQGQRSLETSHGLVHFRLLVQRVSQVAPEVGEVRQQVHRMPVTVHGLVQFSLRLEHIPKVAPRIRVVRLHGQNALEASRGLIVLLLNREGVAQVEGCFNVVWT